MYHVGRRDTGQCWPATSRTRVSGLFVCLSVTSRCSIETSGWIDTATSRRHRRRKMFSASRRRRKKLG